MLFLKEFIPTAPRPKYLYRILVSRKLDAYDAVRDYKRRSRTSSSRKRRTDLKMTREVRRMAITMTFIKTEIAMIIRDVTVDDVMVCCLITLEMRKVAH